MSILLSSISEQMTGQEVTRQVLHSVWQKKRYPWEIINLEA